MINKKPSKWSLMKPSRPALIAAAVLLSVVAFSSYHFFLRDDSARGAAKFQRVGMADDDLQPDVGGAGTPDYNAALKNLNDQKAEEASNTGRSFVPSVVGQVAQPKYEPPTVTSRPAIKPQPPTPLPEAPVVQRVNRASEQTTPSELHNALLQQGAALHARWAQKPVAQGMSVWTTNEDNTGDSGRPGDTSHTAQSTAQESQNGTQLRPGDLLYAINELALNSDMPGPVMTTIASGELKGARVFGEFQRQDEHIIVKFNKLLPPGSSEAIQINAYAIDPNTASHAVRTAVDNHYLERWGGLIAASFIEGLANAKSASGSTTTSTYAGGGGTTVTSNPQYSISDQAWIAAGKVGEKLSDKLSNKFDRAPTVTLDAGQPIGILIL